MRGNVSERRGIDENRRGNVIEMRGNVAEKNGIDENRSGNAGRFEESNRRKNLSRMMPKATAVKQHASL
jgi:hypothetical protein